MPYSCTNSVAWVSYNPTQSASQISLGNTKLSMLGCDLRQAETSQDGGDTDEVTFNRANNTNYTGVSDLIK